MHVLVSVSAPRLGTECLLVTPLAPGGNTESSGKVRGTVRGTVRVIMCAPHIPIPWGREQLNRVDLNREGKLLTINQRRSQFGYFSYVCTNCCCRCGLVRQMARCTSGPMIPPRGTLTQQRGGASVSPATNVSGRGGGGGVYTRALLGRRSCISTLCGGMLGGWGGGAEHQCSRQQT